jgi:hypothetical protein
MKKLIIISVLTLSFLFASLHYQQKRADAVAPIIVYVAANIVASIVIGVVLHLIQPDSSQVPVTVSSVDPVTGAVNVDPTVDNNGNYGKTFYSTAIAGAIPAIPVYWSSNMFVPSGFNVQLSRSDAPIPLTQAYIDTYVPSFNADYAIYNNNSLKVISNGSYADFNDSFFPDNGFEEPFTYEPVVDGLGGVNHGLINNNEVDFYDYSEDVPQPPSCFDGIWNQDETDIDCGGVCDPCPPPETCFDGIMNQDETGIDYGGVCGVGEPVAPVGDPVDVVDQNNDGIDDITGLDSSTGTVPVSYLSNPTGSEYDTSMPGDVSEVGDTNWSGLITGWIASNPLVMLAQNSTIELQSPDCVLTTSVFGTSFTIDFCSMTSMIDLIGTFVLGLMTVRSVFIAMGI